MNEDKVSRAEFIRNLGLGGKALMAFYCLGVVSACTSEMPDPMDTTNSGTSNGGNNKPPTASTGVTGTTSGNAVNFTVDLTNDTYKDLKTKGNYAYVDGIIIANANVGYVALSKECTHAGTTVTYRKSEDDIHCSNHGSLFKTDGSVKKDPATMKLTSYAVSLSMDGNTLTVKS